jgi:DnaJ-domain-containing protein 1
MQNAPAVAVRASRLRPDSSSGSLDCQFCGHSLEESFLARHLCPSCGKPQAIRTAGPDQETFFTVLAAPEKFKQDLNELQKRFYEVSRALHPDRFTTADEQSRKNSLDRMSFLNDAYRTLKTPVELRDYVLEHHGLKTDPATKGQIPMQLAESWFDLQDSLAEDPDQAESKLLGFEKDLREFREGAEARIAASEKEFDLTVNNDLANNLLNKLGREIQELSYLKSMDRDVERLKARLVKP